MARLLVNTGNGQPQEIQLVPGLNRVGRTNANDIQLDEPSVSSRHCEITCNGNSVRVKDLGSTNGTFINKQPIQEAVLEHGQRLQLGSVEMILDSAPAAAVAGPPKARLAVQRPQTAPTAASVATPAVQRPQAALRVASVATSAAPQPSTALRVAGSATAAPPVEEVESAEPPIAPPVQAPPSFCKYHRKTPGRYACGKCRQSYCELCVNARPGAGKALRFCRTCGGECVPVEVSIVIPEMLNKGFFAHLPGAFVYPFKKNGVVLMIIGTVVFALLSFAARFSIWAFLFGTGYFISYMQRIMTCSGYGEEELPGWPEFSEFWSDIILPMLLFGGTVLACIAPALVCMYLAGDYPIAGQLIVPLFVLGGFYFPMALLTVGMTDNIFSLNPLIVIPSILKVFLPYLVATIFLGVLYGVYALSTLLLGLISVPVLDSLIVSFLSLYFTTVQMRILGLMYFTNKERLGWFNR